MEGVAGGVGAIGAPTGTATLLSIIATFTSGTATGVAAITAAAIVPDTPGTVPVLPAIVRVIPGTVVPPVIVHLPQPFQVRAIVRGIALPLRLCLQVQAIARMAQTIPARGRAGGHRVLCRPLQGIVPAKPRAHGPAQVKREVISVRRLAPCSPIVRMHSLETGAAVRRARAETRVWPPRVAGEVASGANSYESRLNL
jgi:hypothetical protein